MKIHMKTNIKLSVIIPVYNSESCVHIALESLQKQSFQNFEIICVNDGSTDNSLKVLEKWAKKDSRIKIVNLERNMGLPSARNAGIEIAKGEWIAFLDADDAFFSYAFESLNKIYCQEDVDVVLMNGVRNIYGEHCYKETFYPVSIPSFKTDSFKSYRVDGTYFSVLDITNSPLLTVSKAFLDQFSLRFFDTIKWYEDIEFNWHLASCQPKYYFLQEILYCYNIRMNKNSFSSNLKQVRNENSEDLGFLRAAKEGIDHLKRLPNFFEIELLAIKRTTNYALGFLKEGLIRSDLNVYKSSQKWLKLYLKELHSFLEELDVPYAYKRTIFLGEFSILLPVFSQKWDDKFFDKWLEKNLKLLPFQKHHFLRTLFSGSKVGYHARIVKMRIKPIIRNILSLGKNTLLSFGLAFRFIFTRRFRENLKICFSKKN